MAKNSLALPDNLIALTAGLDKAKGFPTGTMASLLMQESGGRPDIWNNPTTPHYPTGTAPNGKRSSAFGPFGLLESTANDPGYGVSPLKDKTLGEQARFAADYLDARSKSAGSLNAGLAGYGEGAKYSQQVARRRDGVGYAPVPMVPLAPVQIAAPSQAPVESQAVPLVAPEAPVVAAAKPVADPIQDQFQMMLRASENQISPEDLAYGKGKQEAEAMYASKLAAAAMPVMQVNEDYQQIAASEINTRPNFGIFQGLARLGKARA